jgi:hypothetical protein
MLHTCRYYTLQLYSVAGIIDSCYSMLVSRKDKLKTRFLSRPKDFTFDELRRLLRQLGYDEQEAEGSRVTFYRESSDSILKLHRPHPQPTLKIYQINQVLDALKEEDLI